MTTIWTVIGDILSVLTIGTCLVSKFPQILTIYQQKSAQGLSLKSLTIEVISYSISTLYNFTNRYRWINYFEYIVLIIQDYILVAVVLFYRRQINQKTIMIFTSYVVIVSLFGFSILPKSILTFLIPGTLPMSVISKSMQLVEIIRTKDSRAISSITWFISAFSNLTRIYTIMLDSMDYMLLTNFVVSTLLSSAVFVSVLYYKNPQKVKDN
ncbi:CLUMA_CG013502, isoform A [Clunio marinus]|uniref:Solute carrier family 66 member 3 n=1 Tax=Clunio marinus TaxID=568069 RepID=A0A1J1IKZ9_9DIPT|nr:CLUMA_CG013502, isoform A [Clunio marinus]